MVEILLVSLYQYSIKHGVNNIIHFCMVISAASAQYLKVTNWRFTAYQTVNRQFLLSQGSHKGANPVDGLLRGG